MHGLLSLASVALNLFREFIPGHPDAARFWLEIGAGSLSLLIVLGLLLRFFGSENARPALLTLGATLGLLLLAAGPAAVELYFLPTLSPSSLARFNFYSFISSNYISPDNNNVSGGGNVMCQHMSNDSLHP